jgi:hypothetical protein
MVGAFSYNIFTGVFVAFIFGSAFFFDLFWPERHEDRGIILAWKGCAVAASMFTLSSALLLTVLVARYSARVEGVSGPELDELLSHWKKSPLVYHKNGRAVASVVLMWLGALFTIIR